MNRLAKEAVHAGKGAAGMKGKAKNPIGGY
jgi:hypothetical protein